MRSRSLRPALRIPASATPSLTPFTGNKSSGRGGLKLTAIFFRPLFEAGRPPACPGSSQFAVTVLVFFSRSTRAGIVATDLAYLPDERGRLRVFLRVTAQMDSLAQVVERGEMLQPVVVERR